MPPLSGWSPEVSHHFAASPAERLPFTQLLQVFRGTWHNITVAVKVSKLAFEWRSACCETDRAGRCLAGCPPQLKHMLPTPGQLRLQIVETPVTPDKTEDVRTLVEFTLGQDLAHPNVVQTFERTNCLIEVGPRPRGQLHGTGAMLCSPPVGDASCIANTPGAHPKP